MHPRRQNAPSVLSLGSPDSLEGGIAVALLPRVEEPGEILARRGLPVADVEAGVGDAGGEHLLGLEAREQADAEAGVEVVARAGRELRILAERAVDDRAPLLRRAGGVLRGMDHDRVEVELLAQRRRVRLDLLGLELQAERIADLHALL